MTTETNTNEIPADTALTVDEAADAIFAKQTQTTTDDDAPRNEDGGQEVDEGEANEDTDQGEGGEGEQPEPVGALDDHVVEINGQRVKVGDLKRLASQEAELTQAAQAVAQRRQEADARFETSRLALDKLIERAQAAYKPYETIDWVVAQKDLTSDELRALRTEAKLREDDLKFLTGEADQLRTAAQEEHAKAMQAAAQEAHKVLPEMLEKAGGKWDPETFGAITEYAVKAGFPAADVANWVNPLVIAMTYKAMRYDAIRRKATPKPNPTVVPAKPASKGGARDASGEQPTNAKASAAFERLKKTGSVDDAAEAIFARMTARR